MQTYAFLSKREECARKLREYNASLRELELARREFQKQVTEAARSLLINKREAEILRKRFSRPERTREEVGKMLDVTRERVRQVEFKALLKMEGMDFSQAVALGVAVDTESGRHNFFAPYERLF